MHAERAANDDVVDAVTSFSLQRFAPSTTIAWPSVAGRTAIVKASYCMGDAITNTLVADMTTLRLIVTCNETHTMCTSLTTPQLRSASNSGGACAGHACSGQIAMCMDVQGNFARMQLRTLFCYAHVTRHSKTWSTLSILASEGLAACHRTHCYRQGNAAEQTHVGLRFLELLS